MRERQKADQKKKKKGPYMKRANKLLEKVMRKKI